MSKQEKLKGNVKYKDTLFKKLFGQNKENALSLYNAINGTTYTMEDCMYEEKYYIIDRDKCLITHD